MSLESYAHKAAKDVVLAWLTAAKEDMRDDIYACCLDTNWVTPSFWQEYPFVECHDPGLGSGMAPTWEPDVAPPTFAALRDRGTPPIAILDIAVAEHSFIRTGIEIVHKNPPADRKMRLLRDHLGLDELLILPSRWVLGQVGKPRHVPAEFWAWGGPRP